jgi:ABC-type phosphate transport system substrate-binding protein
MNLVLYYALTVLAWSWNNFGSDSVVVQAEVDAVLELHGSGTSNPSKCYWSIMESLTEEAGVSVRLTYRSIGSVSGIAEFASTLVDSSSGNDVARLYFASGDIPVPSATYANITSRADSEFVHLPVMAGVVSFFHSVPDTPDLNLSACVLAQIYTQTIVSWGDEQIVELNPNLSPLVRSLPITAARRKDGSSSTDSSTKVCFCYWLTSV